jgi:DNA ligase-1
MIELFEALANEPSRTGKQKLLAINTRTPGFKEILRYALDPYRRYYIRKLPPTSHPRNCSTITWKFIFRLLDQLSARKLTGHEALAACTEASGKMTAGDAALFQRILLKDLRCGVSINTVNSVYKGLLPEFKLQLAGEYNPAKAAWPAAGDIKYDGMRAVAIVTDDVEFLSRGGRAIKTMDRLKPAVAGLLPLGGVFDGELIVPAGAFESSMSAAKRDAP